MDIKVSVIIPVYNNESYIEKCIKSLLQQNMKNIEFIFVNDGSTDNSFNIINNYREIDNRIKLINKKNGGVSSARNLGIKYAVGEYIGFVDSDDTINKQMYQDLYYNAKKYNVDIVMCSAVIMDSNGTKTLEKIDVRKNIKISNIINNEREFIQVSGSVWKGIYRSNLIKKNNILFPLDLPLSEDKLFNMEAIRLANSFMYIDKYYYNYTYNSESAVRKYNKNMLDIIIRCKLAQDKWLIENNKNNILKELYDKQYIYIILQCIQNEIKNTNSTIANKFKNIRNILNNKNIINDVMLLSSSKWESKKTKILYLCIKYRLVLLLYIYSKIKL